MVKPVKPSDYPYGWKKKWQETRDLSGVLGYLSAASVNNVKDFAKSEGKYVRGGYYSKEDGEAVEALLKALSPSQDAETPSNPGEPAKDRRPLQDLYLRLVPACTHEFVDEWLKNNNAETKSKIRLKDFTRSHGMVLKQHVDDAMANDTPLCDPWLVTTFKQLTAYEPPTKGVEHRFSTSMEYSEQVLKWRLAHLASQAWPSEVAEVDVYESLLRRCVKRRVAKVRIKEIMHMGLELLKARPRSSYHKVWDRIWSTVATGWIYSPDQWQDLLTKALHLGLSGNEKEIGNRFLSFPKLKDMEKPRKWALFRLYNLHVPKSGYDIDTVDGMANLAKKRLPETLFYEFETQVAIQLLKSLIVTNEKYEFLHVTSSGSILRGVDSLKSLNFNAKLLLRRFQSISPEKNELGMLREEAQETVEGLMKRSAGSRESPERAKFAKAACFVAISSGSLDLYGTVVDWLQRFIRDNLTAEILFANSVVGTKEGIQLLSATPAKEVAIVNPSEISKDVSKANQILQTFQRHMQIAKREPSYQESVWRSVSSLFERTMDQRATNARDLIWLHKATDRELYSAIWSQSFALLAQMRSDLQQGVRHEFERVLSSFPPDVLHTATRSLLKMDNDNRANKAESSGSEDGNTMVERLTYSALMKLAKSREPVLAKDLIVQTIIDRPDASSWHRQLLTLGYMNSLPAKDAEGLLLNFANAIGEKLQEQSYVRIGEAAGTTSIVKVSTVKYLAQLLKNARFISADIAIRVLVELMQTASHSDVKIATFESLISSLIDGRDVRALKFDSKTLKAKDGLVEQILTALESVIPIAGSINERRPPSEQDWKQSETDSSELPEASQSTPLLETLLNTAKVKMDFDPPAQLLTVYVHRVLLPTISRSTKEHKRWLHHFLNKHVQGDTLNQLTKSLPVMPVSRSVITSMLQSVPQLLPVTEFQRLNDYAFFLFSLPDEVKVMNKKFTDAAKERSHPDIEHWLSFYDCDTRSTLPAFTGILINHLLQENEHDVAVPVKNGIANTHLYQKAILSHLRVLVSDYDHQIKDWDNLLARLKPPADRPAFGRWLRYIHPLLTQTLRAIEAMRQDRTWFNNPERRPLILPRTTQLRLWSAFCPRLPLSKDKEGTENSVAAQCTSVASDLASFVREELKRPTARCQAEQLATDVQCLAPNLSSREMVLIGLQLGEIASETSSSASAQSLAEAESVLLITIARNWLQAGNRVVKPETSLAKRVELLKTKLTTSSFESVREIGIKWRPENVASGAERGAPSGYGGGSFDPFNPQLRHWGYVPGDLMPHNSAARRNSSGAQQDDRGSTMPW